MAIGSIRRLGLAHHGRFVAARQFADAEFDEPFIYERECGRLIVRAPRDIGEVLALNPWRDRLILFQHEIPGVIQQVVTPNWVRPDEDTDRIGDIGVFLADRSFDYPDGPPDLMYEIARGGATKEEQGLVIQRFEYQILGVREYVVIDRLDRKVTVHMLGEGGYAGRVLGESNVYESPLLPGFAVRLSEVF